MRSMRRRKPVESGAFTLLEVIVALAILAILFSLLVPSFGAARSRGRATKCASNLRFVGQSISAFANAHEDRAAPVLWEHDTIWDAEVSTGWDIEVGNWAKVVGGPDSPWQCPEQRTSYVGNARALGVDQSEQGGQRYTVPRTLLSEPSRTVVSYDLQYNLLADIYIHARNPSAADLSDEYYPFPRSDRPLVSFWMPYWGPHHERYGVLFGDGHCETGIFVDGRAVLWLGSRWWPDDIRLGPGLPSNNGLEMEN